MFAKLLRRGVPAEGARSDRRVMVSCTSRNNLPPPSSFAIRESLRHERIGKRCPCRAQQHPKESQCGYPVNTRPLLGRCWQEETRTAERLQPNPSSPSPTWKHTGFPPLSQQEAQSCKSRRQGLQHSVGNGSNGEGGSSEEREAQVEITGES